MKTILPIGAFLMVASVAQSAMAFWAPTYSRCYQDQLWISSAATAGNLPKGRREWAIKAYYDSNGDADYWSSLFDEDVNIATAVFGIEVYPVYKKKNNPSASWIGPGPYATGVGRQTTYSGIKNVARSYKPGASDYTNHATIAGLCEPGCYASDQTVRFSDGAIPIHKAHESGRLDLITLDPSATFESLIFTKNEVALYTIDEEAVDQDLVVLKMTSGGELRVTPEHPIVAADGTLKRARELRAGDDLVREDGSLDEIEAATTVRWTGRAYNIRPITTDPTSNILVAQGYLNGSARHQNEYVDYLNRVVLRATLPEDIIPLAERNGVDEAHADR